MPSSDEQEAHPRRGAPPARLAECVLNHGTHQRHADLPIKGRAAPEAGCQHILSYEPRASSGAAAASRCFLRVGTAVTLAASRKEIEITTIPQQWKAMQAMQCCTQ